MSILSVHDLQGIAAYSNTVRVPTGHNLDVNGKFTASSEMTLPVWTEATRPASPDLGSFGYNTDLAALEYYDGTDWLGVGVTSVLDDTLIYVFNASGNIQSPSSGDLGSLTIGSASVSYTPFADVIANTGWQTAKFTSLNKPYVMWRFARTPQLEAVLANILAPISQWPAATNDNLSVTCAPGSSGLVGKSGIVFQHNNGGSETHDIPTLGYSGNVWSTGMFWGQIDSTTNYGGILNTPYPHTGSSGGNTGDTLLIYLEGAAAPVTTDYTNYLTPSGPLGDAQNFSWTYDGSSGLGGSPSQVADASNHTNASNWTSDGFQQNGTDRHIRVDFGQPVAFDYTFAIGYANGSHYSNQNTVEGSNDGSSWTTLAQWRYHNGTDDSHGYLYYGDGSHTYANTINNASKWIPMYNDGSSSYRYYRLRGQNFNATNNYQLVTNWGLLKKNES